MDVPAREPLRDAVVPAKPLRDAFEQRCMRLRRNVDFSLNELAALHASRLARDSATVRAFAGDAAAVRSKIERLSEQLYPQLNRLTEVEQVQSAYLPPRWRKVDLTRPFSENQRRAAILLQAVWRRRRRARQLTEDLVPKSEQYCPVMLRRDFVRGLSARSKAPPAAPPPPPPRPAAATSSGSTNTEQTPTRQSAPTDGRHFMSIL